MTRVTALSIVCVVFILKTAQLLTYSASFGRLAMPGVYDDISYFTTAAQYLDVLLVNGLPRLLQFAAEAPPHSPGATLLALAGLYFSGGARWAAYAMNVVVLSGIFTVVTWRFRPVYVVLLGAVFATMPLFDKTVTTFHPDLLAGLFAGAACIFLMQGRLVESSRLRIIAAGALIAFSLLMKPVAVPLLGPLYIAAMIGILLIARWEGGITRQVWGKLLLLAVTTLVLGGWFIFFRSAAIYEYIWGGLVAQSDVWRVDMTLWQNVRYYLHFLAEMLGTLLWPGVALVMGASAAAFSYRRDLVGRLVLLGFLCGVAWLLPTLVTSAKTFFFGGVLYGMVFWLVAYCGSVLWEITGNRLGRRVAASIIVIAIAILGIKTNQDLLPREMIAQANEVFSKTSAELRLRPTARKLFLAQVTLIPPQAYIFEFLLEGRKVVAREYVHQGELSRLLTEMASADIVGLQDEATIGAGPKFAVNQYLDTLVQTALASRSLKLVQRIRLTGGFYYVFARGPALMPVFGAGWGRLEGPYPEWNLDHVRWMEKQATVDIAGEGTGTLKLQCRLESGASVEIRTLAGTFLHPGTGEFEDMNVKVSANETVSLTVKNAASNELALLCEEPQMIW